MRTESIARALADPTRLRIMRLLTQMELAVGELAQILGQSQPRVSRHVAILCASGLAERRKEGSWTFLRLIASRGPSPGLNAAVVDLLEAGVREDEAFAARCEEDRRHLAAIRTAREAKAAEYFERHAPDWDRLRSMISPPAKLEAALLSELNKESLGCILDIGTGTGSIVRLLIERGEHAVGLDRSTEMLRLARARLQNLPAKKWELVQADFGAIPAAAGSFDTVVLHQVLHYASDPAIPLAEAGRVCRPGGRIAIVDLAAHEHEELRTRHAHARLGFTDEQMLDWLSTSGFGPSAVIALPGRKLTTKIWVARRTDSVAGKTGTSSTVRLPAPAKGR
jgi:ArsR family transcriptional regulator